MARGSRRPKIPVPLNYSRLRIPREEVVRRITAGNRLRRGITGTAEPSCYDKRGVLEV